MKRICKKGLVLLLSLLMVFCLVGCVKGQSAKIKLDSGHEITIDYDNEVGLSNLLYDKSVFYIGEPSSVPLVTGYFATEETFEYYCILSSADEDATIMDYSDVFNNEFLTYRVSGAEGKDEIVHIYRVVDTNLFIVLVSYESEEFLLTQKDCLKFKVDQSVEGHETALFSVVFYLKVKFS